MPDGLSNRWTIWSLPRLASRRGDYSFWIDLDSYSGWRRMVIPSGTSKHQVAKILGMVAAPKCRGISKKASGATYLGPEW